MISAVNSRKRKEKEARLGGRGATGKVQRNSEE